MRSRSPRSCEAYTARILERIEESGVSSISPSTLRYPRNTASADCRESMAPLALLLLHDDTALVIGGGVAGLTAALGLSSRGYRVTIVEQDLKLWRPPGRCTSEPLA